MRAAPRALFKPVLRVVWMLSLLLLLAIGIVPHTGLYRPVSVLSDSMRPTFERGDLLIVTPTRAADLRVGDVITFRTPLRGHPVESHRILEILRPGDRPVIRTKGDANKAPDPWDAQLDAGDVWRVRLAVPELGWLIMWLREPLVHNLAIFVAPGLLALRGLFAIWLGPRRRLRSRDALRPSGQA